MRRKNEKIKLYFSLFLCAQINSDWYCYAIRSLNCLHILYYLYTATTVNIDLHNIYKKTRKCCIIMQYILEMIHKNGSWNISGNQQRMFEGHNTKQTVYSILLLSYCQLRSNSSHSRIRWNYIRMLVNVLYIRNSLYFLWMWKPKADFLSFRKQEYCSRLTRFIKKLQVFMSCNSLHQMHEAVKIF